MSCGIPMPVSFTLNSMAVEAYLVETVTLPFSVNLMALLIRFWRTCLSFSPSVLTIGRLEGIFQCNEISFFDRIS